MRSQVSPRRQQGQSVVEIAAVAPFLLVLVLTAMNVGIYVSDMLNAGTASRQAARLAALLGGGKHVTPAPQTSAYDAQIVQAVQASAGNMPYASVTEIDIYQPSINGDGSYAPSADPADEYNGNGSARSKQTFPLTSRSQTLPGETPIGVRVVWTFRPPTGFGFPSATANQYTVFRALAVP